MGYRYMKKAIVITSINNPTEAVITFSKLNDYRLIVVGDKKTHGDWTCNNATYLSIEKQNQIGRHLNKALPFNHYCRKMFGYLYAVKCGSSVIVDIDDDIMPKDNWSFPLFDGKYDIISSNKVFVNIYGLFTKKTIWPRGLPLRLTTG
jgi:hypothetical protein